MNVIFDYGSVLVGWKPQNLLEKILPDPGERAAFEEILDRDYIPAIDVSANLEDFVALFPADYPRWAEAARLYRSGWTDMLGEEIPGMANLIRKLRIRGYGVYGLTNWNRETFDRSRRICPIMRMIPEKDLVVSGDLGYGKPDSRIYDYALHKFSLEAGECVFVDDREANVKAAVSLGMKGVVFHGATDLVRHLAEAGIDLYGDE